jgi:hypothetical protein
MLSPYGACGAIQTPPKDPFELQTSDFRVARLLLGNFLRNSLDEVQRSL